MAVSHSANPHRFRNVFFIGVAGGVVLALVIGAILPGGGVSKNDVNKINDRLSAIEQKITPSSPQPAVTVSGGGASQPGTGTVTVSVLNKDPNSYLDKTISATGKVSNSHEGVGFFLTDTDGTYVWVHFKGKLPAGSATVKGKATAFKDQLTQWKTENGWPADDATLTAKLRGEKIFIEAETVS